MGRHDETDKSNWNLKGWLKGEQGYIPDYKGESTLQTLSNPIRENLAENLYPLSYDDAISRTLSAVVGIQDDRYTERYPDGEIGPDGQYKLITDNDHMREKIDLLQMVMGQPQKYNTIKKSKYIPTKSKEKNIQYYTSPQADKLIHDMIRDDGWDAAGKDRTIGGATLGQFTINHGEDEYGKYISYYDEWDINPLDHIYDNKKLSDLVSNTMKKVGFTPPELYNRIYKKDIEMKKYGGKPSLSGPIFTEYREAIRKRENGGPESESNEDDTVKVEKFSGDWATHPFSSDRGAFPRMAYNNESGEYPNLNLSKAGFMSLAMAQFFGYDKSIQLTSGERLGYDQWRVVKEYKYPKLGIYPREFRNIVKDSVKTHGFDTEEGDQEIINYIEDLYQQYENGEITESQLKKKVGSHITGDAGDFTGSFRRWLTKTKSKVYRDIFNITPLNEGDHFHVPFHDISVDNIPEKYKAHWYHYSQMFDNLSHITDRGKQRINMNPTAHTLSQLSGLIPQLPMIDIKEIPLIVSDQMQEELPTRSTPIDWPEYTPERKTLLQKIFGYRKYGGRVGEWRKRAKAEYGKAQEQPVDERALRDNIELIQTTVETPMEGTNSFIVSDDFKLDKEDPDWTGTTQGDVTKLSVNKFGWANIDSYREQKDDYQFIMNTQNFLIDKGFNIKDDGLWGNKTYKAINEYLVNKQLNSYSKTNFTEDQFYDQIYKESHGKNNTVSSAGAMGIAQFMPNTFAWAKEKGWIPQTAKITDQPAQSLAQRKYMDYLFEDRTNIKSAKTKTEQQARAFAAYNMGPGGFDNFWETLTDAEKKAGWKTWYKKANNETKKYVLWMMDKATYKKENSKPYTNKRGKITSKWNDVYYGYETWRAKNLLYRY